jgi:hypothetical protein
MGYVIYFQFKQHKQLPSGIEDGHPNNLKMDIYNHLYKSIYGGFEGMVLDVDDLSTAILTAGRFFVCCRWLAVMPLLPIAFG